ncbi:MAG: serine protein kinase PrkA [bacterium]|nr:serine protein kinase PrkA [bacterium]
MNDNTERAIETLKVDLEHSEKRPVMDFQEYLDIAKDNPEKIFRNIFRLFHDMVKSYVEKGEDEYPDDPESIGFMKYDCSRLFVHGSNNPFFADRLFANRFVRQAEALRQGSQQNRIYVYEGPPGCGKSTFLNNLLRSFEEYSNTEEGRSYEIFWDIKIGNDQVQVPCPSHDYPILLIPKNYRVNFLDNLLSEKMTEFKHRVSNDKEYEWLFEGDVCTICRSLFRGLLEKLNSLEQVLGMVKIRPYKFDRRLGEGISVFNPGDQPSKLTFLSDKQIQERLDRIFGANLVKYVFSLQARTNNGIYVLMDIKSHNKGRLLELHNVISEGIHKVNGIVEERISSLFVALMNPEDKKALEEEKIESFLERIQYNAIPYVLDVPTEVKICQSTFGEQIGVNFLPGVIENFARVIISSRMNVECVSLKEWIPDISRYKKYCDEAGLLLRTEIYGGVIPSWLSEEDRKKLTAKVRRRLIAEGEQEGKKGFSGRESIRLFGEFFSRYGEKPNLINMNNVADFFRQQIGKEQRNQNIPKNFIISLLNWYNYRVLSEVKESLYFYNEEQIVEIVLHYLCAVNYDIGANVRCPWTGRTIEVTVDFLKIAGAYFVGKDINDQEALLIAGEVQKKYVEVVAAERSQITETELYKELFVACVRNLKEKTFEPFLKSDNFKEAVKAFGTGEFETFDTRLREHVAYMVNNLVNQFGYTEQGAKEICLYVVDQKLIEKFS